MVAWKVETQISGPFGMSVPEHYIDRNPKSDFEPRTALRPLPDPYHKIVHLVDDLVIINRRNHSFDQNLIIARDNLAAIVTTVLFTVRNSHKNREVYIRVYRYKNAIKDVSRICLKVGLAINL